VEIELHSPCFGVLQVHLLGTTRACDPPHELSVMSDKNYHGHGVDRLATYIRELGSRVALSRCTFWLSMWGKVRCMLPRRRTEACISCSGRMVPPITLLHADTVWALVIAVRLYFTSTVVVQKLQTFGRRVSLIEVLSKTYEERWNSMNDCW